MMHAFTIADVCLDADDICRRLKTYNGDGGLEGSRRALWDSCGPAIADGIQTHFSDEMLRKAKGTQNRSEPERRSFAEALAASPTYCYSKPVDERWVREIAVVGGYLEHLDWTSDAIAAQAMARTNCILSSVRKAMPDDVLGFSKASSAIERGEMIALGNHSCGDCEHTPTAGE